MLILVVSSFLGLSVQPSSSSASDRKFLKIYSGTGGFCGITEDENYVCVPFQTGFEKANLYIPTDLTGVRDVAKTSYATCALLKTHKLRCWVDKRDDFGELGQPPADLGLVDKLYSGNERFCVILRTHKVKCWTPSPVNAIASNLPGSPEKVKTLAIGRESYCTLNLDGKILCIGKERWGGSSDFQELDDPLINPVPPKDFGSVRDIQFIPAVLGNEGFNLRDKYCAVNNQNEVACWRNGPLVSPILNQAMSQATFYVSDSMLQICAIAPSRHLNCWNRVSNEGVYFPTVVAENMISMAFVLMDWAHHDLICGVDISFNYKCWKGDGEGPVPIPVKADFPELQRPQNQKTELKGNKASFSWDLLPSEFGVTNYKVALSPGNFSCITQVNSCQIPGLIPGVKYEASLMISNPDGFKRFGIANNLISVPTSNFGLNRCPTSYLDSGSWENLSGEPKLKGSYKPDSNITGLRGTWPSGTKFCSFWIRDGKVADQNQDGTYQVQPTDLDKSINYVVIGTDVNGNSLMRVSDSAPFRTLCTRPGIEVPQISENLIASRNTVIDGYITRCPFDSLDSVIVRFKQAGESWSGITKFPTKNQAFRISRKFPANTTVQIGVDLGWKKVWQPSWRMINIEELPARHEFSATYSNLKIKGFNQGGILYYKFQSDKPFNGTCGAIANNDNAFNFALTYMGSESHLATFKVKNGQGTGSQQMRWNGVVGVTLVCTSEAFKTVTESSSVTLRSNF
jgi:hypothetical protein